ncbi:MAG: glucokinase [Thermoanaerobaculia bacterium]|nr:glucokinase [Thermoanaerobaculia bacterium]
MAGRRAVDRPFRPRLGRACRQRPGPGGDPRRAALARRSGAGEAARLFSGWLGALGGDLVLTLGARGGLHLAGGMLAAMGAAFDRQRCLARFLAKGRFAGYLGDVPVRQIVHPAPALLGARRALLDGSSADR